MLNDPNDNTIPLHQRMAVGAHLGRLIIDDPTTRELCGSDQRVLGVCLGDVLVALFPQAFGRKSYIGTKPIEEVYREAFAKMAEAAIDALHLTDQLFAGDPATVARAEAFGLDVEAMRQRMGGPASTPAPDGVDSLLEELKRTLFGPTPDTIH